MKKLLFFILALLCSFTTNFAQSEIAGTVYSSESIEICCASVTLYSQSDGSLIKVITTDEDGYFELTGIEDGEYFLEASWSGYTTASINHLRFPAHHHKVVSLSFEEDTTCCSSDFINQPILPLEKSCGLD